MQQSLLCFYVGPHVYNHGYVEEVNGAPMCGYIEHMPVVSCTGYNEVDVDRSVSYIRQWHYVVDSYCNDQSTIYIVLFIYW